MSKTVGQLKLAVAGFLQRGVTTFLRGEAPNTFDLLLNACNNARLYVERKIDFEYSTNGVQVPMSLLEGGNLDNAVLKTTQAAVRVKKIRTAYFPGSNIPVELWSKRRWTDRVLRTYGDATADEIQRQLSTNSVPELETRLVLVQDGKLVFFAPANAAVLGDSFTLEFDAFTWLDDYTTDAQTDFILDYCFDWMMYRSIMELNHYLKEDERIMLSASMVQEAWDAVVKWNNELVASTVDDTTLD